MVPFRATLTKTTRPDRRLIRIKNWLNLAKKVRAGGSGTWGTVAMALAPATVSDADLKAAIACVLTLK